LIFAVVLYKLANMNPLHPPTILALCHTKGLLRPRDLQAAGLPRAALAQMVAQGQLHKLGRGLYAHPARTPDAHEALAEVATRSAHGVVCLISALRFHQIGTQQSPAVWLAIGHKAHPPKLAWPTLQLVRMSGAALEQGIEQVDVNGVPVRVFCLAKTVADCFKYRNKIGLDVALEALREAVLGHRVSMDQLWHYANLCRVERVMRPYLEMLGALA
jgi:predicted transcriptional regulator of viral defense system